MSAAWLVGNDVVDLRVPENASVGHRPRFLARVCDEDEQARVRAAADPVAALWALFAAKEAAYKVVSKLRPGAILAHRRFRVAAAQAFEDIEAIDADGVRLALWLDVDVAAGRVHAVASTRAPRPLVTIEQLAPALAEVAD
ncbi:MAG: 4'-phosphopantetheinyl transferase superfamily protein, partial [Deltaproteobacteria bacterium]|nr:4'-phosphopantetheinyl transferase superfamily protein [Kofleriaceae bacterium]